MLNGVFIGDIMPGGLLHEKNDFISSRLQKYLQSFDFRVGTLEAAIGDNLQFDPVKMAGRKNIIFAPSVEH